MLNHPMRATTSIDRRKFLKASALFGGGLFISFDFPTKSTGFAEQISPTTFAPNAFLRIGTDNSVLVILSKVEMGQGIWTTLAMFIAEELDCDWNKIKVEHSPVAKEYTHTFIPTQGTAGSTSTMSEFERYRKAGATARVMLVEAAAKKLGVLTDSCRTENGFVIAGDKKISYGEVAIDASKLPVPTTVKLREAKDWKYIGTSPKRLDSPEKINGKAKFGIDIQFPDLLTAVVAHAPTFSAKIKSFDANKAKKIKGVRDIVEIPTGIAVIADDYWTATRGRDALSIEWDLGANASLNTQQLVEEYRKLSKLKGKIGQEKGNIDTALSKAVKTIESEFTVPFLAHAPMEPLNCTVKLSKDKCEIWTGTQLPTFDQNEVAKLLNFKPEQVEITTPFLGGGFGRRGSFYADWIVEAVNIAKASGKFIKLIWSREDDMKGGHYRPMYLHNVVVGLDEVGLPVAWQHQVVGQSVFSQNPLSGRVPMEVDDSSIEGIKNSPYLNTVPNYSVELHTTSVNVPVLPWRSVGKSHTIFVMETMVDELAYAAGKTPVEYRKILLKNHPRLLAILNLVVEKSEWDKELPKGQFRGIATHEGNGSCIAQVVELSIENKKIRVHRVVCAIDCGLPINPNGIIAQMESSIVFGLTAALYGEITFEKGQVQQSNFNDYRMLRMNEMPTTQVHIMPSSGKIGGTGEPAVPIIAPALANALFAATGKRFRNLPVRL